MATKYGFAFDGFTRSKSTADAVNANQAPRYRANDKDINFGDRVFMEYHIDKTIFLEKFNTVLQCATNFGQF